MLHGRKPQRFAALEAGTKCSENCLAQLGRAADDVGERMRAAHLEMVGRLEKFEMDAASLWEVPRAVRDSDAAQQERWEEVDGQLDEIAAVQAELSTPGLTEYKPDAGGIRASHNEQVCSAAPHAVAGSEAVGGGMGDMGRMNNIGGMGGADAGMGGLSTWLHAPLVDGRRHRFPQPPRARLQRGSVYRAR